MDRTSDVLVIGGGIAGLTAALCLKKEGYESLVFESKEDKQTTTSGINLSASGVRVLDALGLSAAIQAKAYAVRFMRMLNSQGQVVAELSLFGREQYGHDSMAMTRRVLHNVLTDQCKNLGIPIHYNCRLISLEQDAHGVVANFDNGVKAKGRVLIGADGIHSAVRGSLFPELQVERKNRAYFGCGALIPNRYLTAEEQKMLRLSEGSMNLINGTVGFVGFIGIGRPDESGEPKFMFWSHIARAHVTDDFDARDLTKVKQVLLRLRGSWCRPVEKVISLLDQQLPDIEVICAPIFSNMPIPAWSNGRVVLIGDASHGYGPGAGGAALAMEDAMLLARMMKRAESDSSHVLGSVFGEFETKRRPRVERIGNAAEARNDGRLEDQGWWRTKAKEYFMWLYAWWCRQGYYDSNAAYRIEDDL
jgi:2-polyprenyl-6-methoxyphenol hydroxylase-like FAD-dependent oxidoreductase